jgi:hypothetical protein
MLETLDAKKFCSGHSDIIDREQVKEHIEQMKQLQEKVMTFIYEGKSLEEIQGEFEQSQSRLIESIFSEIKENPSP